jgi:hypothetical protein
LLALKGFDLFLWYQKRAILAGRIDLVSSRKVTPLNEIAHGRHVDVEDFCNLVGPEHFT